MHLLTPQPAREDRTRAPQCRHEMVRRDLAHRLIQSPYGPLRRLHVQFHEGIATLRGKVPTHYHKQIAQAAVLAHKDVAAIVNRVEVKAG